MSDDELRAAAEYVVNPDRNSGWPAHQKSAAASLAAHYLAEYPADDSEPVTEGWLRSIGFAWRHDCRLELLLGDGVPPYLAYILPGSESYPGRWVWADEEGDTSLLPGSYLTRGHVRRLLAALGIAPIAPEKG